MSKYSVPCSKYQKLRARLFLSCQRCDVSVLELADYNLYSTNTLCFCNRHMNCNAKENSVVRTLYGVEVVGTKFSMSHPKRAVKSLSWGTTRYALCTRLRGELSRVYNVLLSQSSHRSCQNLLLGGKKSDFLPMSTLRLYG